MVDGSDMMVVGLVVVVEVVVVNLVVVLVGVVLVKDFSNSLRLTRHFSNCSKVTFLVIASIWR